MFVRPLAAAAALLAAATGVASAQPGRPATLSLTLINQSDTRVTQTSGDGGCSGTPNSVLADPGKTAALVICFAPECGSRSSATGIKVGMATGQTITCPALYSGGGAYTSGQAGVFACHSAPYHR